MATLNPSPPPFTFRIVFSGLCFFDTDKPVDPGNKDPVDLGKVRVLLPNLLLPKALPELAPPPPDPEPGVTPEPPPPSPVLDPHFPLLEFSSKNLFKDPLPPGVVQRAPDFASNTKDHPDSSCCLLLAETLSILVDDQPASGSVASPPFDKAVPDSLFWLASLKKVFGSTAPTLKPNLVPQPGNKPGGVITSIELAQGTLSTTFRSRDEFAVKGTTFSQRLALELTWEVTAQNRVILQARQADGSVSHLVLAPDDPLRDPVVVHVQNREIDNFIGIPSKPEYLSPGGKFDFAVYKDLLDGTITNLQVPLSLGAPAQPDSTHTGSLGSCPPGTS
jgi:hypothetical protein